MTNNGFIDKHLEGIKTIDIVGENYLGSCDRTRIGCRGIVAKDSRILVTHELVSGWYLIPGGGLENGETPEECCARELHEETGYIVEPTSCFLVINEYYENVRYIGYFFLCECRGAGKQHLTDAEKERGLVPEWIDADELYSVFGRYDDYYGVNEEKRGSYQREFTALTEYISITRLDRDKP